MKKIMLILVVSFCTLQLFAQTSAKGIVKDAGTGEPIPAAKVTLLQQNISTQTNTNGEFYFSLLEPGSDEMEVSKIGYFTQIIMINLSEGTELKIGEIKLKYDVQAESRQDIILQLSEAQLDDEGSSQSMSSTFSSNSDVYISQTSYAFSPMRFRTRGYDNKYESTYINGVRFEDAERGGFNYSSIGGLNNATRNKDLVYGLGTNTYSYGNLGGNTNINTRASSFATGSNANAALSNRAYRIRGQYTYGTGILPNGWAFAVSGVIRWANEGIIDGTFYNSGGLFLSAEKFINESHSISLVAFGAPTRRAQQGGVTQEVYDLAGSIYYNPYWGYQDGKVRNSRIVKSFDPITILTHEWKIDNKQRLRTGVAFHYSMYSNSALAFYNAPDPRPDYYRNLPSFAQYAKRKEEVERIWTNSENNYQVNWGELYEANRMNNQQYPDESAKYILERRHNNLMETTLNSTYTNLISSTWKITAGIEGRWSKGMHYKTIEDLLEGNQWIDIDPFAERDFPADSKIVQNDINDTVKIKHVGDKFGYNYDIHVLSGSAFAMSEWNFHYFDVNVGVQVKYTQFYRYGHMKNGRAPENSFGKGNVWYFVDPSVKVGFTYKINPRNRIFVNALAETRAPLPRDSYVSDRIKDTRVPNLQSEKILSYDLNYTFSYPFIRGRVSAFQTHINGANDKLGYYDDEYKTFVNHLLTDANKIYRGVEAGITVPIVSWLTISAAGTVADYHYTSDSWGIKSFENGAQDDKAETVLTKDLKINNGPQTAANITLSYFHRSMLFIDVTLNYYDNNYLDFAPNRFTVSNMAKYTTNEIKEALGEQEKLKGGFMLDASIGKVFYLKNRKSLNLNLSLSNILNNTDMITGGYQQARLPLDGSAIETKALNKFPNKYYYAWGFNFFLNVGFKF